MEKSLQSSLQLDSLHGESLIWTQKQLPTDQEFNLSLQQSIIQKKTHQSPKSNTNKFYRKDDLTSYIKPDYGSLGEFITGVNLTTDFLKQKKKKFDYQQDSEQKKIKNHIQNKNLNKILTNPNSSPQQRNIACKLFIERTFEQAFGSSINQFYQQQIYKQQPQQRKKTLNINSLSDALDQIVNKSYKPVEQKPNRSFLYLKQNLRKNRSFLRDKTQFINEKQIFLKKLSSLKTNYKSLQKLSIPQQAPDQFSEWEQRYQGSKHSRTLYVFHQSSSSDQSRQRDFKITNNQHQKVFIVNQKQLILYNLIDISSETVLYILSKINLVSLQEITIIKSTFSNSEAFNLFLDLLGMEARNLQAFVIDEVQNVHEKKIKEKFCEKVKNIVELSSQSLLIIKLNNLGLQTKDFCVLCLGMGSAKKLQMAELKNNNIDETAKKSFDVLVKFFRNLQVNLQGNPINNEILKYKGKSSTSLGK